VKGPDPSPSPESRFVVLDGSRLAGLKDWRALADVAALTRAAGAADGMLLDVRRASFTPASHEGGMLAAALAGYPAVAIVSGGDASYGCARMVCTLVELRGSTAEAFLTEGAAEAWLLRQTGAAKGESAAVQRPRT
jgi:hypothetical protein